MSVGICLGRLISRKAILALPSNCCKKSRIYDATHTRYNIQSLLRISQRHSSSALPTNDDLGVEIYHGPLASTIRRVKLFSLATSLCGLMFQPVIIQKMIEEQSNIGIAIFSGVVIQFFTFVTPVLLHYVTKKYVRIIYFNQETDSYTSLTYNIWTGDQLKTFKSDDVEVPDIPGMFTSIIVKGTPMFVDANYFGDISHYKRLMGFDKPIDFKLEEKPQKP